MSTVIVVLIVLHMALLYAVPFFKSKAVFVPLGILSGVIAYLLFLSSWLFLSGMFSILAIAYLAYSVLKK